MHPTRIDLTSDVRLAIIGICQARLADGIDLSLRAKHAHWNVRGPQFMPLHKHFDDLAAVIRDLVDILAERIGSLGGAAAGLAPQISAKSCLPAFPDNAISGRSHLEAMAIALAAYGKATREDIDKADELGDAVTADIFTQVTRTIDQQLWFIEAHLQAEQ